MSIQKKKQEKSDKRLRKESSLQVEKKQLRSFSKLFVKQALKINS